MKALNSLFSVILFFVLISCENNCNHVEVENLKACSFNIRFDNPDDGYNKWENRRKNVVIFLGIEKPDVIGFQEVLVHQLAYIHQRLVDYEWVGVGRDDGAEAGEYAPVFFRKERFELNDEGTFWLSEEPDKPSIGWDAQIKRICTYAFLTDIKTGKKIHVYNTHLSHVSSKAREESVELIIDKIAGQSSGARVILTGDFNTEPGSDAYNVVIEGGLADSYESEVRLGPVGTFNGFRITGFHDRRIDFIFIHGFHSKYYVANSMLIENQYLSDHFPVLSLLAYD